MRVRCKWLVHGIKLILATVQVGKRERFEAAGGGLHKIIIVRGNVGPPPIAGISHQNPAGGSHSSHPC